MSYVELLYFALPCFVANMLPMIFHRLDLFPSLKQPMDGYLKLFGKRLFGEHKTVRGLVVGVLGAVIVSLIQWFLHETNFIPVDYLVGWYFVLFGLLSGLGAIFGDAIESFIKRQVGVKSGDPLIVFDQIDYMVGYLLLTSFIISWSWHGILFLILFALIVNPIFNAVAYLLKIKKTYW